MSENTAVYFDGEAETWSGRYNERRQFRDRLLTVLRWVGEKRAGIKILDYGCGSGDLLTHLAKADFKVTGIDISAGMLKAAMQSLQVAGVPSDRFRLEQVRTDGSANALQEKFDGVISLGVLEYLDDPTAVLQKLSQALVPGGFLIISVPNRTSLLRRFEGFVFRNPAFFEKLGLFPNLRGPQSYLNFQKHQFTLAELDTLLGRWGLARQREYYHAGPPAFAKGLEGSPVIAMTFIAEFRKAS